MSDYPERETGRVTTPSSTYVLDVPPRPVRVLGTVTDLDGCEVPVGVDYDAVTIGPVRGQIRLNAGQRQKFLRWFSAAEAEAEAEAAREAEAEAGDAA